MNLLDFFRALYTDYPDALYLWTMPEKATRVFLPSQLAEMASTALRLSASGQNVYFGVGGADATLGKYQRPKADGIRSIPALWCDIDIAGAGHAAQNLPPDIQSAEALLPPGLPPSVVVDSGHGLHAYWLFKEPWDIDGDSERAEAVNTLRRLQGYARREAAKRGWTVDATADLPRVLRCPDTMNYKLPSQPALCRVIHSSPARYNPSDFDVLPEQAEPSAAPRAAGFERRETDGPADAMLKNCAFMKRCQLMAGQISYGEWMAALSNIVRASDGVAAAHELSALDAKRYNAADTEKKIGEVLGKMNPQGCEYIRNELGFKDCPAGGCGVKAPCVWSLSVVHQAKALLRGLPSIDAESVYRADVIAALSLLQSKDRAEYGRFLESCRGRVDIANLKAAIREHNRKGEPVEPDDVMQTSEQAALASGQRLGDVTTLRSIADSPLELAIPPNFSYGPGGVFYMTETREGNPKYCRACGTPIIMTRRIYNVDTETEKVELAFKYIDHWRTVVQPKENIYSARNIICLSKYGVNVTSESSKYLVRYLSELENANRIPMEYAVSRMGWRGAGDDLTFLTPADSRYRFDMDDAGELTAAFCLRGTLAEWLDVSRQVRRYPAARFVLAASFAAPLLKVFNHRNFMIYFWGTSGGGKTAAMIWALSVWGLARELMVNFNMSMAGLEGRLALTNDLPAGINERQVAGGGRDKQEWLERVVYMVEGGRGKARATTSGIRRTLSWRTIGLACGEEPLSSEASVQGVKTRLLEFNSYPVLPNDLAKSLYSRAERCCGHAGSAYMQRLISELKNKNCVVYDAYTAIQAELTDIYPEYFAVHIDAVALVCLADFLVSQWLFGMSAEQARSEARELANYIVGQLQTRTQISDIERGWEFVKGWIAANGERFDYFNGSLRPSQLTPKYGIEEYGHLYIYPDALKNAMQAAGLSAQKILKELADMGKIESIIENSKRRFTVKKQVNGVRARFIDIDKTKLDEE